MADTYKNTTEGFSMTPPSDKHKLKYSQDFDKGTNALQHTPYMRSQKQCENRDNAIIKRQKKHY